MERGMAGMQAGMAGALLMLAWLGLTMLWARHSVWWFPNLMATTFGGDGALRAGWNKYTASGLALHLTQYSALGAAFALAMPARLGRFPLLVTSVIVSVGWYYLMYGFVWRHVNALIPLYSPDRQILVAHVLFGLMLARFPRYETRYEAVVERR